MTAPEGDDAERAPEEPDPRASPFSRPPLEEIEGDRGEDEDADRA